MQFLASHLRKLRWDIRVEPTIRTSQGRKFSDLVLPSKEQVVVLNVQVVGQRIGLSEAHHLKVAKYSVPEVIDQVRGNSFPGIQCDPLLPGCVGGRECWVPGRFRF